MIQEHAKTYKDRLTIADLDYMVKKANRLGKNGREVLRIYQQEDADGFHVYFEVTGLQQKDNHVEF